jgi:hypothetical protein
MKINGLLHIEARGKPTYPQKLWISFAQDRARFFASAHDFVLDIRDAWPAFVAP